MKERTYRQRMLTWLHRPLPPTRLTLLAAAIVLTVALYCVAYNAAAGRNESLAAAIAWACINILPWVFAFEGAKRAAALSLKAFALGSGLAVSLLLHAALDAEALQLPFEIARRIPGLLIVAGLLAAGSAIPGEPHGRSAGHADIGGLAERADWIAAAGNYVEFHLSGGIRVLRGSLHAVESELADRGFVRIHRSTLVRRDRIARIRPSDVILDNGTSLKIGKRYRARLTD